MLSSGKTSEMGEKARAEKQYANACCSIHGVVERMRNVRFGTGRISIFAHRSSGRTHAAGRFRGSPRSHHDRAFERGSVRCVFCGNRARHGHSTCFKCRRQNASCILARRFAGNHTAGGFALLPVRAALGHGANAGIRGNRYVRMDARMLRLPTR